MRTFLTILAILVLGFFIYKNTFKVKEGVTFTNYDNYHTFNMKPWDEFLYQILQVVKIILCMLRKLTE